MIQKQPEQAVSTEGKGHIHIRVTDGGIRQLQPEKVLQKVLQGTDQQAADNFMVFRRQQLLNKCAVIF